MKKFNTYKYYIYDVDGTLYFKNYMRLYLIPLLLKRYLINPKKLWEIRLIYNYRKLREKPEYTSKDNFEKEILNKLSTKLSKSPKYIKQSIQETLLELPLKAISKSKDKTLIKIIKEQKHQKKIVIIYSDYPTKKKLETLGISNVLEYYPGDGKIFNLKPNTKPLQKILEDNSANSEDVLYIGDRYEKEGVAAKKLNIDYMILSHKLKKRKKQWKNTIS